MTVICLFLFFGISAFCSANASSLQFQEQYRSPEKKDNPAGPAARLEKLEKIIPRYLKSDPKLALANSRKALEIANTLQNHRMQALSLNYIGNSLRYLLSDYDLAVENCLKGLEISKKHSLKPEQIRILLTIGEIYQEVGNSYKALEHYMQAQVLAERLGYFEGTTEALNKTGQIYGSLGNEGKATEYHQKALMLSRQHSYPRGTADSHFLLAKSYQKMSNHGPALQNHETALEIRLKINDSTGIGYSYLAIGRLHLQKEDYQKTKESLEAGLSTFGQLKDYEGLALAYNYLGSFYTGQQDYAEALPYLNSALAIGENQNNKKIIRDSYENLYTCYAALKDYEQALKYKDWFVAISDLIYGEESERRMAELQTRFEIAEKEREIASLRNENQIRELAMQKQAGFRDSLIVGFLLLLIILILTIFLYRNNRRNTQQLRHTNKTIHQQNLELQELNATKDKFFSIISHDMKGPLNSLTAFSGMLIKHSDSFSREEIQMLATDFDKSLKNLLSLLENLLEWSRSQTGVLEIRPEPFSLQELVQANIELLQKMADNKNIRISSEIPPSLWAYAGKNQMNTVLRNLISNGLKFTRPGGEVKILAREWKDALEVRVQDSGIGMGDDILEKLFKIEHKHSALGTEKEKGTGLGLLLCREFIEQNNGSISVESKEGEGSTFIFTIPKAEKPEEVY